MQPRIQAPDFDLSGLSWFNVDRPIGLEDTRGRLVILDFWTYCCINCIQIIPTLKRLERAFPEDLVVIGVHSPKFSAEKDAANVELAISRYGVEHPIIHDPDFEIWQAYGVRAWPTLMFVGPDGELLGQASGEPDPERLMEGVGDMIANFRQKGVMSPAPLVLTQPPEPAGRLSFPGKMKPLSWQGSNFWAVADGGHHQIAVFDAEGAERLRIGSGDAGFDDGELTAATFEQPQGLVCGEGVIYVADTGNHAIRAVDLETGTVTTLAGVNRRGPALTPDEPATGAALASPWDLELSADGNRLYIANAGTHQLGYLDLAAATVHRLAGDGGEDIVDGPAAAARLAQPSGLALSADGGSLFFADSETSSVRAVDLGAGTVGTLVGAGLFEFGHVNGDFGQARLQHALGVALDGDENLLVADSYNAAVRLLDRSSGQASDFDGGVYTCTDEVCLPLGEPAGIAADPENGRVFVVDTNNHRVLAYDTEEKTYGTWVA